MTAQEDILQSLKRAICAINPMISINNIPDNKGLLGAGLLDSLGFVEFITHLEKEYQIKIIDEDLDEKNFANLGIIAEFIIRKISK
jgi:acyl carrier protein